MMNSIFYLPRRLLSDDDKTYTEAELLAASNHIVVLAEPGAGKTELMKSIARQLRTSKITANVFGYAGADVKNSPLVIDAVDELAKIDPTGINKLFTNAKKANATGLILSSRSSEWDEAATKIFEDFLGRRPLVVRLYEFDEAEQRAIFEHHLPGEDFTVFQAEVARFDLAMLLPNPQFLQLFASAYIESERHFSDKRSIFAQAVKGLAKEANIDAVRTKPTLSIIRKIDLSSDIFARLLLSGAEGISTGAATESRMYPLLASLFSSGEASDDILATRLFKPGDSADQHRPVHRIVAEYCAADYLTKRIADPGDPLTLSKCLPIIAPNTIVRDELRGLLGWMATLGDKAIGKDLIELDPYAVLANGDLSQLERSLKRLLINQLKQAAEKNPHFRRSDFRRTFSVAGFFTREVVEEIKSILDPTSNGHLRGLIVDLLAESPVIDELHDEVRQLVLSPYESRRTRLSASRYLFNIADNNHRADLERLISEASNLSLEVAAEAIEIIGPETFEWEYLENFFRVCARLYPGHREYFESRGHTIGTHYFVKRLINCLALETIEWLLDNLTKDLACNCGKKFYD